MAHMLLSLRSYQLADDEHKGSLSLCYFIIQHSTFFYQCSVLALHSSRRAHCDGRWSSLDVVELLMI